MKFIAFKTADGAHKGNISFYCRLLHVTRQGFYQYLVSKDRPWKYQELADAMMQIHAEDECNDTYGRIRMYQALKSKQPEGIRIPSERTVYRIMEEIGLSHRPNHKSNGITKADRKFQLLDRDDDGVSEYPIQASEDIKKYSARELGAVPQVYTQIRIPDNMFIWVTMNSADQGVFPMDTAFKRRWDFTYLGIDDNADNIRGKYIYLGEGKSQKVEWNKLRKEINSFLANEKINEDKQLGPYFISKTLVAPLDSDEIDREEFIRVFKNKVIMYLFEDAAKQKRSKLFEGCSNGYSRYSEICKEFDKKGIGIFNRDIQIDTGIEIS